MFRPLLENYASGLPLALSGRWEFSHLVWFDLIVRPRCFFFIPEPLFPALSLTWARAHRHGHRHTYRYIYRHTHIPHTQTPHTYTHTHTHTHAHTHTHTYTYTHTHARTLKRTHAHTYIHVVTERRRKSLWKNVWRLWSTIRLSPTIRSVATGNQWSGPTKSRILCCHWSAAMVSVSNWLDRLTESDGGSRAVVSNNIWRVYYTTPYLFWYIRYVYYTLNSIFVLGICQNTWLEQYYFLPVFADFFDYG